MIPIIFEDDFFIIVDKPTKLLVHRTAMSSDTTFLLQELRNQMGYHVYPVHRLDRPTSGLIIFAKTKEALSEMSKVFIERKVAKTYWAVVRGWTTGSQISTSLRKVKDNGDLTDERCDAVTNYRELAKYELPFFVDKYPETRYSLIEVKPETGRYHQIRRHMKTISHPLIGDTKYGKPVHNSFLRDTIGLDRLMLIANRLEFTHPFTKQEIDIELKDNSDFNHFVTWATPFQVNGD